MNADTVRASLFLTMWDLCVFCSLNPWLVFLTKHLFAAPRIAAIDIAISKGWNFVQLLQKEWKMPMLILEVISMNAKKMNYTGHSNSHKDSGGCLLLKESLSLNVYKVFGVFLPEAQKTNSVHTNTLPHQCYEQQSKQHFDRHCMLGK